MNRRTLLALTAALPSVAAGPASACLVMPFSADYVERQNAQVRRLFEAWWARDLESFRALFTNPLGSDGRPMDPAVLEAWQRDGAFRMPASTRAVFGRFFKNRETRKRIDELVNTDLGIVVGCSETTNAQSIVECSDAGESHLFFVKMGGTNPESVVHLNSGSGWEAERLVVWRNDVH